MIIILPAGHMVAAALAVEVIITLATIKYVPVRPAIRARKWLADSDVGIGAAVKLIVSFPAKKHVNSVPPAEQVVALRAIEEVITVSAA